MLDDSRIVTDIQLKLWHWLSDYYMSAPGDVLQAALPGGLKAVDAYRPKTEQCLALAPELRSERGMHVALDMLKRADRQYKAFACFLSMTRWDTIEGATTHEPVVEVTRDELMNSAHCTSATLKNLVDRKLLVPYEREVGRLNHGGEPHLENIKPLNEAQQEAYNKIMFSFLKKNVVLLHGVTSSGKPRYTYTSYAKRSKKTAGSLPPARNSADSADPSEAPARVRRPPRHIPFKVFRRRKG